MNVRMMVWVLLLLWFAYGGFAETRTYPPILPEGQVVSNIESFYVNTRSEINSVAVSPDGKIIASGSNDGSVRLWDIGSRKPIAAFQGHTDVVNSVTISPNGKMLASGSNDETVRLWDMATGTEIKKLQGYNGGVNSVAFSPDGKTIASGANDSTIRLWDIASGLEIKKFPGHTGSVNSIAFSKDGNTIASGADDSTVRVWDINTGIETKKFQGHTGSVYTVAFNTDNTDTHIQILASGSNDGTIRLWDTASGQPIQVLRGHTGSVNSIVFGQKGKILASGSADKTVRLWNLTLGKEIPFQQGQGHAGSINTIALGLDGKILASGSDDKTINLWDMASGKSVAMLQGHTSIVNSVAFSPDGKTIASGSQDKVIRLWDTVSGKQNQVFHGHTGSVNSVSFNPDGKTLASGSDDKTIRLWDIASGKEIRILQGHTDVVTSVAFSPDGKTIASGSVDSTVRLWHAESGQLRYTLPEHTGPITGVTFTPDGKTLATVSKDRTVRLWNSASGKLQKMFRNNIAAINAVAISPDGKTIALGSDDKTVRLLNIDSGEEIIQLEGHTGSIYSVAFTPNGRIIASGSQDKYIRLWEINSGKCIARLYRHTKEINSLVFNPGGNKLASGSSDTTLCLWEIPAVFPRENKKAVVSVAFSPDGNMLASGSWDNSVNLWNVASGNLLETFNKHTSEINLVAFSPDGKILASGSDDKTVRLWDIASRKESNKLLEYSGLVNSIAFSPDGKILASGLIDNTIHLWNIASGNEIQVFSKHTEAVNSLAFSPDGKIIASGSSDYTVRLWDIATGEEIHVLKKHTGTIYSVAFSPDGNILATGSADNTICLWDVASGNSIATFHGHTDIVFSVAFCPISDSRILASGSGDNTVRLWDIDLEKEIQILLDHSSRVRSVAFSPNGKTIAFGSDDGTVRLWNVTSLNRTYYYGGYNDQWLSIDISERMYRYDDGAILMKKDKKDILSPIFAPITTQKGRLQVKNRPSFLVTSEGNSTDFSLEITNKGKGRLYWVNISQDMERGEANHLIFHPPDTYIVMEPGQTKEIFCKVSALSDYENPLSQNTKLYLKITALNDDRKEPILLDIPIEQRNPTIELKNVWAEKQDNRMILLAVFQNTGTQALPQNTEVTAQIGNTLLNKVTIDAVEVGEQVNVPFAVPDGTFLDKKTPATLFVSTTAFPTHSWEFKNKQLNPPLSNWLFSVIIIFSAFIVAGPMIYYIRYYRHPLVVKLHRDPRGFANLSPSDLNLGHRLLSRTKRLHPLLENARIPRDNFNQSLLFYRETTPPEDRCQYLAKRWDAEFEKVPHPHLPIFKIILPPDFILNIPNLLLVLPSPLYGESDIVNYLREVPGIKVKMCLIIYPGVMPHSSLRELASDFDNRYVVPEVPEITELLLSPQPQEALAGLIASQVKVTFISPYESSGGVKRESLFFGRAQIIAHIMQREPANYLLVGGRQLGKTSLLNALERRYKKDPYVQCDLVCLDGETLPPSLINISPAPGGKRRVIMIDEADRFILAESRTGYQNLHRFRRISEEGWCKFILAGFWFLYSSVSLDYHSPIRNFGELITIEALETDACRQLASIPMKNLNIHYESDEMIDRLLEQTGRRANLIAFTCSRMLDGLDMRKRIITPEIMDIVFDDEKMRSLLGGWGNLTLNETEDRRDRIIVYATIVNNKCIFTLKELLPLLDSLNYRATAEDIKNSLTRLTLAFILKREKDTYSYRVPLFTQFIQQQGPKELLELELKDAKS